MPIDIALIRAPEEGGIPDEVQKWQDARRLPSQDATIDVVCQIQEEKYILNLQKMDMEKRLLLKQKSWMKTRINRLKAALCPKNNKTLDGSEQTSGDLNPNLQSEIQQLQMDLPRVTKEFDDLDHLVNYNLSCLANIVDNAEFPSRNVEKFSETRGVQIHKDWNESFSDPLFCLGGCENLSVLQTTMKNVSTNGSVSFKKGTSILTGPGSDIYTGLFVYGKRYFFSIDSVVQTMHLPKNIALPASIAHGAFGCTEGYRQHFQRDHGPIRKPCQICSHEEVRVPSFLILALMNQNKIFSEKSLPCTYIMEECSARDDISEFVHETKHLELLSFTVNNLRISRQHQNDLGGMILDFYQTLLCSQTELQSSVSLVTTSKEQPLRVRVLPSCDLEMNECRRIVVEGHVPSKKGFVELARVSNYTDYMSRQFKIKCVGGNAQSTDYVHMIKSTLLQETTLRWVIENNLSQFHTHHESDCATTLSIVPGIAVPSVLAPFVTNRKTCCSENGILFLPFIREITKGKGGKMKVIPTKHISEEMFAKRLPHGSDESVKKEKSTGVYFPTSARSFTAPNPNDEAVCNPYEFLPLFRNYK